MVGLFIATLVTSNGGLILLMVVATLLFVPCSLPPLVKVFVVRSLEISLLAMVKLLSLIVFAPIMEVFRRWLSRDPMEHLCYCPNIRLHLVHPRDRLSMAC